MSRLRLLAEALTQLIDGPQLSREKEIGKMAILKKRALLWIVSAIFALASTAGYILLNAAKAKAESHNCASSICSICLGGMLYANEHDGSFPTNFVSFQNELNTPKILRCSGDRSRIRAENWKEFTDANSSYEIVSTNLRENDTNKVFIRCRVHGHLGYPDGTVFDGVRRRSKNH
jgi:hypothetical protein